MAQTLLQLCQQSAREMGIQAPATIISNTNFLAVTLLNLINGVGQQLVTEHPWQGITIEYRFTTVYYEYTGDTTSGSTTVSNMSSTTGLTVNPTYFAVTGAGIPQDTFITAAGGGTVTLSRAATATASTVTLTFSQIRYAFPADFDRLVDNTQWDKSQNWPIYGPETGQEWQWLKSGFVASTPIYRYRQLGGLFQIWGPLGANDYDGFEYISTYWVGASTPLTLTKTAFAVDTDVCVFPDRLMIAGLKMRFAESQGMERYATYAQDWNRQLSIAKAAEAGSKTLSMAPRPSTAILNWWNIQDGNFPS